MSCLKQKVGEGTKDRAPFVDAVQTGGEGTWRLSNGWTAAANNLKATQGNIPSLTVALLMFMSWPRLLLYSILPSDRLSRNRCMQWVCSWPQFSMGWILGTEVRVELGWEKGKSHISLNYAFLMVPRLSRNMHFSVRKCRFFLLFG